MTKAMEESILKKRDGAVKDMPFRVLGEICMKLDIIRDRFDDFRMVVEELGSDKDTIEWIAQRENPTYKLFTSYHRHVKVGRLIEILHKIKRKDAAKVLEDWVADSSAIEMRTYLQYLQIKFAYVFVEFCSAV